MASSQLTLSYTALHRPKDIRQAALRATFGFTCDCERCTVADDRFSRGFAHPDSGAPLAIKEVAAAQRAGCKALEDEFNKQCLRSPVIALEGWNAADGTLKLYRSHWAVLGAHRSAAVACDQEGKRQETAAHLRAAVQCRVEALGEVAAAGCFSTVCDLQMLLHVADGDGDSQLVARALEASKGFCAGVPGGMAYQEGLLSAASSYIPEV